MYYKIFLKRIIDFIGALCAFILLSPLFLVVAVFVLICLGRPIIFKQKRPGRNEKIFTIYKFRTMTEELDGNGHLLKDSLRLNKCGSFLRATSLDELPQLFNIIKGDMAIVGPRPLLIRYLPFYTKEEKLRHTLRPGLTGLAQISGRNNLSWDERLAFDIQYVKNIGFKFDIMIIFKTVLKVIKKDGVLVLEEDNLNDLDIERG
ncbi:sugar transferase [Clostridium sp. DL1XJH146]